MASTSFEDLFVRDIAANRPTAGIPGRMFYDTTNKKFQRDNGSSWDDCEIEGSGEDNPDYILIVDEKTANTSGGTFTSGDWRKRDLTAEKVDTGSHASISSSQITLAAGTYRCHIVCPAHAVGRHKARLRDVTNNVTLAVGSSSFNNSGQVNDSESTIIGQFTLAAQATLEVQHYCSNTMDTYGFGVESNMTEVEVYTIAEFWKVA
jgi:hypothetical protein